MVPWSRLRHGDDGGSREFSHILEGEIARSCLWIKYSFSGAPGFLRLVIVKPFWHYPKLLIVKEQKSSGDGQISQWLLLKTVPCAQFFVA